MSSTLIPALLEARRLLMYSQGDLGRLIGASRRTIQRWEARGGGATPGQLHVIARAVHPLNAGLAAQIAGEGGTTLEALDVTPRAVRPSVLAAFTRARRMGLTVEAVELALRGRPERKSGAKDKATRSI